MIKFDCGRVPGLEKRLKREPEEADRTDAKVEGRGALELSADLRAHCPSELGVGAGALREGFPCRGCLCLVSLRLPRKGGGSARLRGFCPLCRSLAALERDPATVQPPS